MKTIRKAKVRKGANSSLRNTQKGANNYKKLTIRINEIVNSKANHEQLNSIYRKTDLENDKILRKNIDFLVSVEGNKMYEIRKDFGISQVKFQKALGCTNGILQLCEYVAQGKPLTKRLNIRYPNKAITNTTAEKIANSLGLAVDYIFPEYKEVKSLHEKIKATPKKDKKHGGKYNDFMVDITDNKLYEIRTNLKLSKVKFCQLVDCSPQVVQFCESIALENELSRELQLSYRDTKISNFLAERIAYNLGMAVEDIFPKYSECAENGKRVFPFDTIEDRNAAIEAFFPIIDDMVKRRWWDIPRWDLEEFRDVAQLTLVKVADKIYQRGIPPAPKHYKWDGISYTGIDGYFIGAIRTEWIRELQERSKVPINSFKSCDEEANDWLFEKMLYENQERVI